MGGMEHRRRDTAWLPPQASMTTLSPDRDEGCLAQLLGAVHQRGDGITHNRVYPKLALRYVQQRVGSIFHD